MKASLLLSALLFLQVTSAQAGSIYDIKLKDIDGKDTTLAAYKGKVLLIVNVARSSDFYRDFWDTIRLHKQMFEGEIVNKNKSGRRYRAQIRVTPILDEKKRVLYFIGIERLIGKA